MKSKLDQEVLAFSSTLRRKSENSCNFRVDYPAMVQNKHTTFETQVCNEFLTNFMEIMNIIKITEKSNSTTPATSITQDITQASAKTSTVNEGDLREMTGHEKCEVMASRELCLLCSMKMSKNHENVCTGPSSFCPQCKIFGHNQKSCLKPVELKSVEKSVISSSLEAPGSTIEKSVRPKKLCAACGSRHSMTKCQALTHLCTKCWKKGHYPELCLKGISNHADKTQDVDFAIQASPQSSSKKPYGSYDPSKSWAE